MIDVPQEQWAGRNATTPDPRCSPPSFMTDKLQSLAPAHRRREKKTLSILSWNINGVRAAEKKGFLRWLCEEQPDLICLQEIRAYASQVSAAVRCPVGYHAYWCSSARPGYSGTALLSRIKPISVEFGLGHAALDSEGRAIIARFRDFTAINCYVPNGNRSPQRLLNKLLFYEVLTEKCRQLRSNGQTVILCGDLNTAHHEIDLANPGSNRKKSGFLSEERKWLDHILDDGYVDSLRCRHPERNGMYTWWSNTHNARERNIGWRFDYVFVAKEALERISDAFILSEVFLSDHCPVGIHFQT